MSDSFNIGPYKTIQTFRGGVRLELFLDDEWFFNFDTPYWVRVIEGDVCLDLYVMLRKSDKVIISGQDALKEGRRDLPYFYRSKWVNDIDCSFITFNDPSLYLSSDFGAGYLCLPGSRDLLIRSIKKILKSNSYSDSDVIFFGASAGGYQVLSIATFFCAATFIVDIPQINLNSYFRGDSNIEFRNLFKIDILPNIFNFWAVGCFPKKVIFYQNRRDFFHIRSQLSFFLKGLSVLMEEYSEFNPDMKLEFYEISNTRGHSPQSKEGMLKILAAAGIC
jgi:hypothetical protein